MSKKDDFKAGWRDGRAGFMRQSKEKKYTYGHNRGCQEYEYWNKPSDTPSFQSIEHNSSNDSAEIGIGSVFSVVLVWLFVLAPVALFSTWESGIFQAVFWGGVMIVGITYAMWLCNAIEKEREKKKRK